MSQIYVSDKKCMLGLRVVLIWRNFLVVINAQLERKQKLASKLLIEKQRLEVMKRNVAAMENDIARRRSYPRKVCTLQTIPTIININYIIYYVQ